MPVITKISVQKKHADRYNIFVDSGKGEEYAFSVDEDVLIKFQLKKGMELDDFSLTEIHFRDDIRKAYNLAVQFLGFRMRSESEVRNYLHQKETDEPIINEVIHKLTEQKYLDDREFSKAYTRTQVNTTDKGPELIKRELKEKGIADELIQIALEEYPFEAQLETAKKLCEKNLRKTGLESERIARQKLEMLLFRKGFSHDIVQAAIEETNIEKNEEEEMDALKFHGEKFHEKYSKRFRGYEYNQKMKQALYRKGFPFDLIERFLEELEQE